jgi:hypothetical protein
MKSHYAPYVRRAISAPLHRIVEIKCQGDDNPHDVRNNIRAALHAKFGPGAGLTKVLGPSRAVIVVRTQPRSSLVYRR